jgi:hypothetical protein
MAARVREPAPAGGWEGGRELEELERLRERLLGELRRVEEEIERRRRGQPAAGAAEPLPAPSRWERPVLREELEEALRAVKETFEVVSDIAKATGSDIPGLRRWHEFLPLLLSKGAPEEWPVEVVDRTSSVARREGGVVERVDKMRLRVPGYEVELTVRWRQEEGAGRVTDVRIENYQIRPSPTAAPPSMPP